jgi:hypothetical protein
MKASMSLIVSTGMWTILVAVSMYRAKSERRFLMLKLQLHRSPASYLE